MNTYKIELRQNTFFIPTECVLCGNGFEPGNVEIVFYENDERAGNVCPSCTSPTASAKRARERAIKLHAIASRLDVNAQEIEQMPASLFPTVEEIARVEEGVRVYWQQQEKAERVKEEPHPVVVSGDNDSPFA